MVSLLHTALVLAFLAVTAILLGVTILQRTRIREVVMTWPRLSLASAWPVTFVGLIAVLAVFASNTASTVPAWIFAGYIGGGLMWFASSVLGSSIVVSRHGVVCGFTLRENALPWVQVTDYFEREDGRRTLFVFLYQTTDGECGRLEVPVPRPDVERFRFLVDERLEQRPLSAPERVFGRRATS